MSVDEENLIRGQIMTEYLDAKKKLVALKSRASSLGGTVKNLGHEISDCLIHENVDEQLANFPTAEEIKSLMSEIKKVRSQKKVAEDKLRELGFDFETK